MTETLSSLKGKKLLVLSGNSLNEKIVTAAKELGVYTIVADYLDSDTSPAKKIADESWEISYSDIDGLERLCRENQVDGALACFREATQLPYLQLCRRMGYPCYGTEEQFALLANKKHFKELCRKNGVEVIPDYSREDAAKRAISFPVFVKPADNGGSKGQSLCRDYDELENAIRFAESESHTGEVIIERYLADKTSFQVTYFFTNGEAHVTRTVDGYKGSPEDEMERVALCSISPSRYTEEFLRGTNDKVVAMLKSICVRNGPVMLQGFYDDGVFRFYDPGRRFPGTNYEILYRDLFGVDVMKMMVAFALTGSMPDLNIAQENVFLKGERAVVLFPTVSAGTIAVLEGTRTLENDSRIGKVIQKYKVGDTVKASYTTMQRVFEVDFLCPEEQVKEIIRFIQGTIRVLDADGNSLLFSEFDPDRISD